MQVHQWNDANAEQMNPLVSREVLHSAMMTVSKLKLKAGAVVPEHHHINEQISLVMEGAIRFHIGGETQVISAGEAVVIPPNVPHSVEVLEDAIAIDLFTPIREDWVRGDDAYLRR